VRNSGNPASAGVVLPSFISVSQLGQLGGLGSAMTTTYSCKIIKGVATKEVFASDQLWLGLESRGPRAKG
jgi:hypothetical protein